MSSTAPNQLIPRPGWAQYIQHRLVQSLDFSQPNPDRWVVLDVESSGLNPKKDRLISIAASAIEFDAMRRPRISLTDTFEVIIKQPPEIVEMIEFEAIDKSNILIHGIGIGAQQKGMKAEQALAEFLRYVGDSPLIAFHSWFDEILINKALRKVLGRSTHRHWLDLEHLAAVLHKENHQLPLDVWMQRYGIECEQRHQAAADVLATAQLLLKLWPMLQKRKATSWRELKTIANGLKTLPGRNMPS
ncbi:DNA polymerase-3 subunit epsilon [Limnobacter thiooxidans]|uniref:3'-5' exonuclease n=1 Tax=Limnobacter thiooxidans TaxID=131080 RepID=A0AA86JK72_9BURK|nr:3'-5' exonuclease [Limnobacter sp.]MCZ8015493.1 3'-5' exonuclease [Limnobacter sp.]RZS42578.1 DNA polymerase-3 subunit epsilon [Limnobacter thiooxidans]BET25987.1 3'-5' exonuclease [Limnobacter thiooxidans]